MTLEEETVLSITDQLDNVTLQVQDLHSDVDQIKEEQQDYQDKVQQLEHKIDNLRATTAKIVERLNKLETNTSVKQYTDTTRSKEGLREGDKVRVLNPPKGYRSEGTIIGFTTLFIKIRLDQDNKEIRRSRAKVALIQK